MATQGLLGLEIATGYRGGERFRPYVGVALTYMDLDFQVRRPPYTSSANEGLFNAPGFVAYRF